VVDDVGRFEIGDGVMVYTRSGEPVGPVFVLVHGIGMGHRVFRGLAEELGPYGTVYAVDLPGFGDSPEPEVALDMAGSGDFLAAFVTWLGVTPAVLVGHSMGTQVVVEAMVRHPEIADCAVLIAPTVNPEERTARLQAWRMVQDLADESPKVLVLGFIQYVKAGPRWFLRKLRQMLDHHVEDVLPRVRARVLVLRGEDDPVSPRDWTARVTGLLPDATMREVPGRGHEAMIRDPQPVASMIVEHCRAVPDAGPAAEAREAL
jgi:pimeloyl-ACP methyl ester carboxylesterase